MTVYYYIYVYACVSQEERNSLYVLLLCLLLLFLSKYEKIRFRFFSAFLVSFPTTPQRARPFLFDERESKSKKRKEEIPKNRKIFPFVWAKKKKIRLEPKEVNQKIYKRVQLVVTTKTHVLSLRNYVCIAKLYFHRRESCLGEIRQDDQKVRIILSRYRWIFGNTRARKIFLVSLSHFVLYFLPHHDERGGTPLFVICRRLSLAFLPKRESERERHESGRLTSLGFSVS